MKVLKKLTTLLVAAALVVGTSVTVFASSNDDVISALKEAKVPEVYIIQAENYLKTRELTEAEASAVNEQIKVAEDVLETAGVKDVTKLRTADKNKVLEAVTDAGKSVGLTVSVKKLSNGQLEVVAKDSTGKTVVEFSTKQVKQTGIDNTMLYAGIAMLILAAGSLFAVKRYSFAKEA